jgi:cysteine desulfurase
MRSEEIFFTASGTESNNFAMRGVFESVKNRPHFITTNIEHPSISKYCKHVEKQGAEVTYIEVEENGIVDPEKIKKSLKTEHSSCYCYVCK